MSADPVRPLAYRHLLRLTTERGLYEHARDDVPRPHHGYCTDDVARALAVVIREPAPDAAVGRARETYLLFLEAAVTPGGRVRNRMSRTGRWLDEPSIGDWWGRAIAAVGYTAVHAATSTHRERAMRVFARAARQRSADVRASAFAVLGAAEVVHADRSSDAAASLLTASLARIPVLPSAEWTWPERRLRYANATLCEALIAGGDAIGRTDLVARGLELLEFLLELETAPSGSLSLTGSHGRSPADRAPLWDQQPIEASALAEACARAYAITGDARWPSGARLAVDWFLGRNDAGVPMIDPMTGAGYDGLEPQGRNRNRGAESTLAALRTFQIASSLGLVEEAVPALGWSKAGRPEA